MKYETKVLVNRTGKTVEFMCGGKLEIFKPGESRGLNGYVAYHALHMVNTGLEELTPELEEKMFEEGQKIMPDYQAMKYQQLVKRAKRHGWKPGMTKEDVVKLLSERWKKKNNVVESK